MSLKSTVLIITLVTLFAFLGIVPLFDVDEGAFSEATREMMRRRDFITPWLNGHLRFDKPILIYWFQSLSAFFFGLNAYAMRLPSALASAGWAAMIYRFGLKYHTSETGLLAVLMLVSTVQLQLITRAAIADALLNFFLAASLFSFFEYDQQGKRKYLLISYAAMGGGVLTKGPVAAFIPLAVISIYLFLRRRWKIWLRVCFYVRGWGLFLLINLPWYLTVLKLHGMAYVDGFFLKHNINRFHSPMEGHSGALHYYLPVLLVGLMPFTPLLIKAGTTDIRNRFKGDVTLFSWIWVLFVLFFFSVSGTKLHHYVIYGYTPLLLLMARRYKALNPAWYLVATAAFFILLGLVPAAVPWVIPHIRDPFAVEVITGALSVFGPAFTTGMLGFALVLLYFLRFKGNPQAAMIVTAVAMVAAFQIMILPRVAHVMQEPVKEAAMFCRTHQIKPVLWQVQTPSFLFYYQGTLETRRPESGEVVFTKTRHLNKLTPEINVLKQACGYTLGRLP